MCLRATWPVMGVWSVVENASSSINTRDTSNSPEAASSSQDSKPSISAQHADKEEMASSLNIYVLRAVRDGPLHVVMKAEHDSTGILKLLDPNSHRIGRSHDCRKNVVVSHADTGQNMSSYVDYSTSLSSQLERMGKDTAFPESHKAPMLLASIDPKR